MDNETFPELYSSLENFVASNLMNLSLIDMNRSEITNSEKSDMNIVLKPPYDIRRDIYPIMMPIILALCLASLIFSAIVSCSASFLKKPISPTIRLSLSLSAANTAFSFCVLLGTCVHAYLPYVFEISLPMCLMLSVEVLRLGVILVQVYHLLAVALTHYIGVLKPLLYAALLTPVSTKFLIAGLWLIPISGMFLGFSSVRDQGFQSDQCENNHFRIDGLNFRLVWATLFFGPIVVLLVIYFHIFVILKRRGNTAVMKNIVQRKMLNKNIKTVRTTALIVVTFLIGWCPAVLSFLLICKNCPLQISDMRVSIAIFSTCYILLILKVFVDTFIYALRLPEIREALRILIMYVGLMCKSRRKVSRRDLLNSTRRTSPSRSTYSRSLSSSSRLSATEKASRRSVTSKSSTRSVSEIKPLFVKNVVLSPSNCYSVDSNKR